jgi:hypothetical protein
MTAYQNLTEMLAMAIQLRRPAAEIAAIRADLAQYQPQTLHAIRARQDAFIASSL